jgi:hypothetical protein
VVFYFSELGREVLGWIGVLERAIARETDGSCFIGFEFFLVTFFNFALTQIKHAPYSARISYPKYAHTNLYAREELITDVRYCGMDRLGARSNTK